ncbi:uncharacterized protein LOC143210182 [Lasioglossum baleicum]|uniref:uncharacterized protein LOC143210182 n=1 Tax=Lasioglossum baleicum TaxID=434251 RepID=UPI003FCDE1DC
MYTNLRSRCLVHHLYHYCTKWCTTRPQFSRRKLPGMCDARKRLARFKHDDTRKYENLLNMSNSQYLDYIYQLWLKDPASVSPSWEPFFRFVLQDSATSPKTSSSWRVSSAPAVVPSSLVAATTGELRVYLQ